MTLNEMAEFFENDDDEFLKFDRVTNKRSRRADLHAFILLDELLPGKSGIVGAAEHDEIFLDINPEELAAKVTQEQLVELSRCGVRYDSGSDSLAMFV
jgi:hypothetical protein